MYCPKCGCENVTTDKRGYGILKGIIGLALIGPLGLLAGNIGKNDIVCKCLSCGHKWKLKLPQNFDCLSCDCCIEEPLNQPVLNHPSLAKYSERFQCGHYEEAMLKKDCPCAPDCIQKNCPFKMMEKFKGFAMFLIVFVIFIILWAGFNINKFMLHNAS